ncbi:shikimate dehydrogenase [Georgenia sp. 10Sc9-8]|uniref:Shikimate dehydrogenase n=1 Tax=Georgenia halotolerans TaxID=3028317 RepID=A0ABT5U1V4_9MICO|nr:shikimate dehydrogenase [Georgenia halotolerans]
MTDAEPAGADLLAQDVHAPHVRRRAAVLGHPVAHSLSPALHRAAYLTLGLDDWAYGLQDVTAEQLATVLARLDGTWAGLSLTMPLKQAVLPLLDVLDPLAEATGAVNTVVVQPGRLLVGFNTDVHGIAAAVREVAPVGWRPATATVLGARATASSAVAALGELGCTRPTLVARSFAGPGSALLAANRMGVAAPTVPWAEALERPAALTGADVVVSTVPAGVADAVAEQLSQGAPDLAGQVLLDVVYAPWPTALAAAWQARGGTVVPGWAMLLHQAAQQVQLMTGQEPDVELMRAGLHAEMERRRLGGAVPDPPVCFPDSVGGRGPADPLRS